MADRQEIDVTLKESIWTQPLRARSVRTYPNVKISVVENGSTDETAEVAARHARVKLSRQDDYGRAIT